jgi:hypothetical protein
MEDVELLERITKAVREADSDFRQSGGSSHHWVRECFLPRLDTAGLVVVDKADAARLREALRKAHRFCPCRQRDAVCSEEPFNILGEE